MEVVEFDVDPYGILEIRCRSAEQPPLLAAATAEGQGQNSGIGLNGLETKRLLSVFPWIQRLLSYFVSAAFQTFSAWQ